MKTIKSKKQNRKTRKSFNERPLHLFWESLSTGKYLIVIPNKGNPYKIMKPTLKTFEDLKVNPDVKAVLTSGMAWDYRDRLIKKAKKNLHTVNDVIENYKKYFTNLSDNIWYLK
jgi:hypothetical protein